MTAAELLAQAHGVVIKIGSALLVNDQGGLNEPWLSALIDDVARLRAAGKHVVLVSSGSIALGRHALGLGLGALSLEQSQAAAAVGQITLSRAYETALFDHDLKAAQVLVTLEDSANRRRYLNSRATLQTLLSLGAVPIVNENDTVATDEIRFGDNDRLAAQVAALVGAEVLVLLSDVDGLYTGDPSQAGTEHLPHIDKITPEIEAMAAGASNALSKGGMKTKIMAAKTATAAGCAMVITNGQAHAPIYALELGARASVFVASHTPTAARKLWIEGMQPRGALVIDEGAVNALLHGKSLLAAGMSRVEGSFERGDPVEIIGPDGARVAMGLVSYSATEAQAIAGCQSSEIAEKLGYPGRAALLHRNDMALI